MAHHLKDLTIELDEKVGSVATAAEALGKAGVERHRVRWPAEMPKVHVGEPTVAALAAIHRHHVTKLIERDNKRGYPGIDKTVDLNGDGWVNHRVPFHGSRQPGASPPSSSSVSSRYVSRLPGVDSMTSWKRLALLPFRLLYRHACSSKYFDK